MEILRAELAQAKDKARRSDAAALKAAEELGAEQAAPLVQNRALAPVRKGL